tara:strand:+ start:2053 stop:3546 length:1494 start_codon:yes stop_codon:yes gene_type:complete
MGIMDFFKKARRQQRLGRSYAASIVDRLTKDWTTTNRTAGAELKTALKPLRARSRELSRNNDYARRFLKMVGSNVVGPTGIKLQVRAREPDGRLDKFANRHIEENFIKWGKPGVCTMDGKMSWTEAQRMMVESVARDGEIIIRMVKGAAAANEFGFALQFLEADHLDESLNKSLPNGRRIEMSIEFDAWRRPVAYHFLDKHPGDEFYSLGGRTYTRVPAEQILHPFIIERPDQPRGVPWMSSAMLRLQMLGGYEEAEVVAARIGASKMGFFTSPDSDSYEGGGEDADSNLTMELEPGVFEQLPSGVSVQTFDPDHPAGQFGDFMKTCLRGIASGLNVCYTGLANDLEGVNFSSIRQGTIEERDHWRVLQRWSIEHFHVPVFEAWLVSFLSSGMTTLPMRRFDKFNVPVWSPRGWQWVDPLKEVNANIAAVGAGFKSKSEVAAEQGRDLEEIFDALAAEQELAEAKGIDLKDEGKGDENGGENGKNNKDPEADEDGDN